MSSRKIKALEALVERGATPGEREAARVALVKERAKQTTREPAGAPIPLAWKIRYPDVERPSPPRSGDFHKVMRDLFDFNPPAPSTVTQHRAATAADFAEILLVAEAYSEDRVRLRCTLNDVARWMCRESVRFVFGGGVYAVAFADIQMGNIEEYSLQDVYVFAKRSVMVRVTVPA